MNQIKTNYTLQDKEKVIIGTILSCNNEIRNFQKKCNVKLFEDSKLDKYHYKMLNLFSVVTGNLLNENINELISIDNFVKPNNRGNYYAYFQKVNNFLNGFEPEIQKSLNESITTLSSIPLTRQTNNFNQNGNPKFLSIESFKTDLKTYIKKLESNNDFDKNISNDIMKIKIFSNRPIFVYGFDIINNFIFQKEIIDRFKKNPNTIYSICYDKGAKRLLFVFDEVIAYDIETDNLDLLKNIDPTYDNIKYTDNNYFLVLKESINKALVEIYMNTSNQNIKFSDNLYKDVMKSINGNNEIKKLSSNNILNIFK